MPETKAHQQFRNKIEYVEMQLEAVDAAIRVTKNVLQKKAHENVSITDALPIHCEQYRRINVPITERNRIYNFCKCRIYRATIIELYSLFSEYLRSIARYIYETCPHNLINNAAKQVSFSARDISAFTDIVSLKNSVADGIFRSIENERSTKKLINKMISSSGMDIPSAAVDKVLPYFELRHLIVHNNSKIDKKFQEEYGDVLETTLGGNVPSDYNTASKAIQEISAFTAIFDAGVVRLGLPSVVDA